MEKELGGLDEWIKEVNKELRKESVELPENPEPEIERIKVYESCLSSPLAPSSVVLFLLTIIIFQTTG